MLVVTGDRDALQLVSDDVTVLYPRKGVSESLRASHRVVVAGLHPLGSTRLLASAAATSG